MQNINELAINLQELFNPNSYTEFGEGSFANHPEMTGIYYIFKKLIKPKFCLIVNTSNNPYPSPVSKINDYVFIVINAKSIEDYFNNFVDAAFPTIIQVLSENVNKKNERNLPYGYYLDENGKLRIDLRKAQEVKKIYDMYIDVQSVRAIASEMKKDFSYVRDILHDNEEYAQMQQKIIPTSKIRQVNELLAQNVKGRMKQLSAEDEIKEIRKQRKLKNRQLKQKVEAQ